MNKYPFLFWLLFTGLCVKGQKYQVVFEAQKIVADDDSTEFSDPLVVTAVFSKGKTGIFEIGTVGGNTLGVRFLLFKTADKNTVNLKKEYYQERKGKWVLIYTIGPVIIPLSYEFRKKDLLRDVNEEIKRLVVVYKLNVMKI